MKFFLYSMLIAISASCSLQNEALHETPAEIKILESRKIGEIRFEITNKSSDTICASSLNVGSNVRGDVIRIVDGSATVFPIEHSNTSGAEELPSLVELAPGQVIEGYVYEKNSLKSKLVDYIALTWGCRFFHAI